MYTAECPANMCSVRPSIDRTEDRIFAVSTTVAKTSLFPAQGSIHLFIKYCMHFVTITKTHALQLMYKHAEIAWSKHNKKACQACHTIAGHSFQADPHLAPQDCALDWGDFFFNLVSMCIMYAHFNKATASGEGSTAVVFSMSIAAVDVVLLAVRWLWYEHFFMHR